MRILAVIAIVLLISINVLELLGFFNPNEDKIDFATIRLVIENFLVADMKSQYIITMILLIIILILKVHKIKMKILI